MDDERPVYNQGAEQYHRLVSCEDYQQHILPAINGIQPLTGLDVVELGAGTGRITRLLAPLARSIWAFDLSLHMLRKAAEVMNAGGWHNWNLGMADHRWLPVEPHSADLVIAGWSICYLVVWHPQSWQVELERAMAEMRRVLRPGGTILLLETLGTGFEAPHAPEKLDPYYTFLEQAGFQMTWLRTDYRFSSASEAEELTRFFFGDELAQWVAARQTTILPECTGLWHLRY